MEEGWGGVSPGVRKVLGGHKDGAPSWPMAAGGEGTADVECDSIGLEQVAAFRAFGDLSPHPSVTPCPPPRHPVLSPRGSSSVGSPGVQTG